MQKEATGKEMQMEGAQQQRGEDKETTIEETKEAQGIKITTCSSLMKTQPISLKKL